MKINEVREKLETYSDKQLRAIIVEMYKAIPKRIKEGNDIDAIIQNPDSLNKVEKREKKKDEYLDIEQLRIETEQFVEYAYKQYFYVPNKFVSKKDRSQWRFIVKRLYKKLIVAAKVNDNFQVAAELLEKLYVLLCYSCSYILFSAYDPFQTVGIEQAEFFRSVLSLKFQFEKKRDFINNVISMLINNSVNRYTLYSTLMDVIVDFLKTTDMKEMAIEECDSIRSRLSKVSSSENKKSKFLSLTSYDNYEMEEKLRHLAEMGFLCYVSLYEYDKAINYFKKDYVERNKEVSLYVLLRLLFHFNLKDHWIREYETAINNEIKPRENLVKMYQFIHQNGKLPKDMF